MLCPFLQSIFSALLFPLSHRSCWSLFLVGPIPISAASSPFYITAFSTTRERVDPRAATVTTIECNTLKALRLWGRVWAASNGVSRVLTL
ncbi:hypothetical protein DFH08DRAFT_874456 [Mycena albidolilacea]|uniref:Uncharacterized protein n=1 Tax=Mycena albidolilacea TaxID=1033008 RepID=A0AAD7EPX1_9AGAR|nr:hypothetical protein DFH08DRAFT_874456 [Mycena albidolilacea]